MNISPSHRTSVSALMGVPVLDGEGRVLGRVREFAVAPLTDASRVQALVVRRPGAGRGEKPALVEVAGLTRDVSGRLQMIQGAEAAELDSGEDFLLLERDLLDQQIIDVNGHKVVRVNDVDLEWQLGSGAESGAAVGLVLRIAEVEVGLRGAARRMLKGLPQAMVDRVACRMKPAMIPWEFVDLIDRDPARRVRLKIEQDRLAKMHPSDLADILEELAPAERQALFSSLDEEVAADALEEVELKTQKNLIESLDSERLAGIIEEMDPGAAADLLAELPEERSDAILEELDAEDRQDIEELLEYADDSAAGLMTTEYVAVPESGTVRDAVEALKHFDGDGETVTDVFLVNDHGEFAGMVPLGRLLLSPAERPLAEMHEGHRVCSELGASGRKVAEVFDKYNLRCLPVLDGHQQLAGVVHAEDVIAWLRTGS